jgi:L-aspartate oxidase
VGSTGDGVGMAYRAGARIRDMEFVQFHPTVLYVAGLSRFLISEVARGEGATLVDRNGHRFMPDYHPDAELAPRDIVSRSIVRHLGKVRDTNVYLDMRHFDADHIRRRFPVIQQACLEFGIDMTTDLIPVHPACHYMVGGVATDVVGRTSLEGLYAAGEAGSTGFHGANRMGSNSLLEGAVIGERAGHDAANEAREVRIAMDDRIPASRNYDAGMADLGDLDNAMRALMWRRVGIERDAAGLETAEERLENWSEVLARRVFGDVAGWVLSNKMLSGWLVAHAARTRTESRGTHYRNDYPQTDDEQWLKDVSFVRPDLA